MRLPTDNEAKNLGMTVKDLVNVLYPGESVDYALPQGWLSRMMKEGFDPRGCVVWHYPRSHPQGIPAPLTLEAYNALSKHHYGATE